MNKHFQQSLKNELRGKPFTELSQAHLENTISLAHQVYASRRKMRHIGTFEMIIGQFKFIARPVWVLQGIVLLCMCFIAHYAMLSELSASYVPAFLSIASIFIAMTMLPFYGRSRKYKMHEIECTTRVSRSRLVLAKLCIIGVGDFASLSIVIIITIGKIATPAATLLIFIVLPFLLACAGSLFILNRANENYGIFISIGFGMGLSAIYWTLAMRLRDGLIQISVGLAILLCVLLALGLFFECRKLLRQISSADLQDALMF